MLYILNTCYTYISAYRWVGHRQNQNAILAIFAVNVTVTQ